MKIIKFQDLIGWQKAQDLAVNIYKTFEKSRDFGFKDQIQRASVSISNNIAEGFDRMSDREFIRFLYIALASCSEVKSMLFLSNRLQYLDEKKAKELIENADEIGKIIRGLIKSLKKRGA